MYALISWSLKNGVPLKREELEVQSSTKFTVMNGGKMEPGATVNLVFKKDIWAGTIQSIHGTFLSVVWHEMFTFVRFRLLHVAKNSLKFLFLDVKFMLLPYIHTCIIFKENCILLCVLFGRLQSL